jgi:hypothetical protein
MYMLDYQNFHESPPQDLGNTSEKSHAPPLMLSCTVYNEVKIAYYLCYAMCVATSGF